MKTRIILPLGFAAGLVVLAGCTTVNSVENANKVGQRNMVSDMRVVTDTSLNRKVNVVGVNTATTPDGFLKVQVELQNRTLSEHRFLYHFEWFDANGMQVDNALSASLPDQIEGQEDKFISCIAPTPICRDFRVKFIEAN